MSTKLENVRIPGPKWRIQRREIDIVACLGELQSIQQTRVDGLDTEAKQILLFIMNVHTTICDS